jgi:UDP-N-acetylmuramyl pentapeptide phosphotransferase/UDP-N-acetylglucosamine-1-phosphate transferase
MRRVPPYRWLATLPGLLILLGVPFANRVHARVLGMPFLLAWIVGCVLLTSLVMAIVGRLDDRHAAAERDRPAERD